MHFDWTISVGNILTAGGLLIGFYIAHTQNIKKLASIEERVGMMYEWFTRNIVNRRIGEG